MNASSVVSQPNSDAYTSPWALTTQPRSPGRSSGRMVDTAASRTETTVSVRHTSPVTSLRHNELLDRAYEYALEHGLADLSLRPLAAAIGSSPRVLLYLFGSKEGLVRALLARARADELGYLASDHATGQDGMA